MRGPGGQDWFNLFLATAVPATCWVTPVPTLGAPVSRRWHRSPGDPCSQRVGTAIPHPTIQWLMEMKIKIYEHSPHSPRPPDSCSTPPPFHLPHHPFISSASFLPSSPPLHRSPSPLHSGRQRREGTGEMEQWRGSHAGVVGAGAPRLF